MPRRVRVHGAGSLREEKRIRFLTLKNHVRGKEREEEGWERGAQKYIKNPPNLRSLADNLISLPPFLLLQPKQINEIKDFLLTARRKDARCKFTTPCSLPAPSPSPLFPLSFGKLIHHRRIDGVVGLVISIIFSFFFWT